MAAFNGMRGMTAPDDLAPDPPERLHEQAAPKEVEAAVGARDSWPWVDRRSGGDRRLRPTRWFDSILGHRRRTRGRRKGESRNIYVDLYHASDLILLGFVFLLNLVDTVLTLRHLANGGVELNPIMAWLLSQGPWLFVLQKCVVVGACLTLIVVHKTFPLARKGAWLLLGAYSLLAAWHLALLS